MSALIRRFDVEDAQKLADAFAAIGWASHKPLSKFESYFAEQAAGTRTVWVAATGLGAEAALAGYLTIVWTPAYAPFVEAGIPEVQDFNVLPAHRRQGIGSALMDRAEAEVAPRAPKVGIGVGLYADYGPAQRLYVQRGYVPDGRGLTYAGRVLEPGEMARNDDDLVLYFTKPLTTSP